MAIHTKSLTGDDLERARDMCVAAAVTGGNCYPFAMALSEGMGWPMVGIVHQDTIWHVLVRQPDGFLRDARGIVSVEDAGEPFGVGTTPTLRDVTAEELRAIKPVSEEAVALMRRLAEAAWPELPWIDSEAKRVKEFLVELEALSRKHGLWIRGAYPTALPVISDAFGEEAGYVMEQTAIGSGFFFDRMLKGDVGSDVPKQT